MMLNGIKKSALLLMSIGSDQASEILKYLTPFEIQELVMSMVNMNQFSNTMLNTVLSECYDLFIKNNNVISDNSENYVSDMLTKTLGEEKGNALLSKALEIRKTKVCIDTLNSMSSKKVALLLDKEHPQIITTILVNLNKNHTAEIMSFMNSEKRAEIILRMMEFNGIKESNLSVLNNIVDNLLATRNDFVLRKGGIQVVSNILKSMKIECEQDILKKIGILNKDISNKIIKEMYLFENIIDVDDASIKLLIDNLDKEKLYIALQGTNVALREKFFKNMSTETKKQLSHSLKQKTYISRSAIKNEQKLIIMIVRNILDNGTFLLKDLGKYYV